MSPDRKAHRRKCPGLHKCMNHPVAHIVYYRYARVFKVWPFGNLDENDVGEEYSSLIEAMRVATDWERYGYE